MGKKALFERGNVVTLKKLFSAKKTAVYGENVGIDKQKKREYTCFITTKRSELCWSYTKKSKVV